MIFASNSNDGSAPKFARASSTISFINVIKGDRAASGPNTRRIVSNPHDFASMKGGVRGKYVKPFREGTNIVLVEPEVAQAFPTEDAVNAALRGVLSTAVAVRRTGGLPDKALQPTSPNARRRKTRREKTTRGIKRRLPR